MLERSVESIDKDFLGGKTALITGVSESLGCEIARLFDRAGAKLALILDPDGKDAADSFIKTNCPDAMVLETDMSSIDAVHAAVGEIKTRYGGIDILVNYSPYYENLPLDDIGDAQWDMMFERHVKSAYHACRAVAPVMKAQKHGRIINISSVAAKNGGYIIGAGSHYTSAMAALLGLTRGLAIELAPFGIAVNCLCPSVIEQESAKHMPQSDSLYEKLPWGRAASATEIAGGVLFLAADIGFMIGYSLDINGGLFMD